ncbi:MAG: hypothetical protein UY04_C0052G0006 [Parcubacteria group bacterium GW2011_GWA2_47_7]|nr:MAG: hypothetical protein UY04_C0052G0006 [Parcubacteria group bacterium GW2011_GWA2_47_7]
MGDFSTYTIKDYEYWTLSVHPNQGYLGRCIIWCKRENALDLADATDDEQKELFVVLGEAREAAQKVFQPDWINYAFLGNETRHLHGHFLPRYSSPKEFEGVIFTDEKWGHNYATDYNFITPPKVLEAVRLRMQKELN